MNWILCEMLEKIVFEEVFVRWMYVFYVFFDGLSVEYGIYDEMEFEL